MARHVVNAANVLARAEAAGISFRVEEGEVRMSAAAPPPADLLTELRQEREAIGQVLSIRQGFRDDPEMDHDEGEAEAMAAFYAALAGPPLPNGDPLTVGLLRGFRDHR